MTHDQLLQTFNQIKTLFNLRKDITVTVEKLDYFGKHTKTTETTLRNNRVIKKVTTYSIKLCDEITSISDFDEVLSPITRTLIHEIVHHLGYINHTKKFQRKYIKMCVKWCACLMCKSIKEIRLDKNLVKYICRYALY